jgi:hypothetical protein
VKEKVRTYQRIISISMIVLLVLLVGFQLIPLTFNETSILSQVGQQKTRSQRIAKDVYVLAYRPEDEHAQAVSELQNTLPAWEQTQLQLQNLRIGGNISIYITQSQPDFTAEDTAARKLLASANAYPNQKVDITQVDIIAEHERGYFLSISQFITAFDQHIQSRMQLLVYIESGIAGTILVLTIVQFVLIVRQKYHPEQN